MSDYRETFKRKEVKYRLSATQAKLIEAAARAHLELSLYGQSTINSLYFDTPDRRLIARSLEKPLYKEKLRLRWYENAATTESADVMPNSKTAHRGIQNASADRSLGAFVHIPEDTPLFLEMKKKFKGIVYKRRVEVTRETADQLLRMSADDAQDIRIQGAPTHATGPSAAVQEQIAHEIESFIYRHKPLIPSALIKCERLAFEEVGSLGLRITFDRDLRADDLITHERDIDLLEPGEVIMEIKCSGPFPMWLVRLLSDTSAYPTSFSKYGELYKAQCESGTLQSRMQASWSYGASNGAGALRGKHARMADDHRYASRTLSARSDTTADTQPSAHLDAHLDTQPYTQLNTQAERKRG